MHPSISARFVFAAVVVPALLAIGCKKEEAKTEPPAPTVYAEGNTASANAGTPNVVVQAPGQGQPHVQVQAGGTAVKINASETTGATARAGAAQARGTANAVAPPGKDVTIRTQDGRSVVRNGDTVTMEAADGRKITTQGGKVVMEDPTRPGAKIVVDGTNVTATGAP